MAVQFTASGQYLGTSTPVVLAPPFTVGMWYRLPAFTATRTLWSLSSTTNVGSFFRIYNTSATLIGWEVSISSAGNTPTTTTVQTWAGDWAFLLVRFAAVDQRSGYSIDPAGRMSIGNNTTSRIPPGINVATFGANRLTTGVTDSAGAGGGADIGEFFIADSDWNLQNATTAYEAQVQALARYGPFAMGNMFKSILEYRSHRTGATTGEGTEEVWYHPKLTVRPEYDNVGAVTFGSGGPPCRWVRPGSMMQELVV